MIVSNHTYQLFTSHRSGHTLVSEPTSTYVKTSKTPPISGTTSEDRMSSDHLSQDSMSPDTSSKDRLSSNQSFKKIHPSSQSGTFSGHTVSQEILAAICESPTITTASRLQSTSAVHTHHSRASREDVYQSRTSSRSSSTTTVSRLQSKHVVPAIHSRASSEDVHQPRIAPYSSSSINASRLQSEYAFPTTHHSRASRDGVNLTRTTSRSSSITHHKYLEVLCSKYDELFAKHKNDIGRIKGIEHNIRLFPNTPPIARRPHRESQATRDEKNRQIKKLLELGIIRVSTSPYVSPSTLAPKSDGSRRLYGDYRDLNSVTIIEKEPIPHIQDVIDRLSEGTLLLSPRHAMGILAHTPLRGQHREDSLLHTRWSF